MSTAGMLLRGRILVQAGGEALSALECRQEESATGSHRQT